MLTILPSPYVPHAATGLLHLPRFLAKCRYVKEHGALPASYAKNYKRGMDKFLCLHLGIDPAAVEAIVHECMEKGYDDAERDRRLLALFPPDLRVATWNRDYVQKGMTVAGREFLKTALTNMGCADRTEFRELGVQLLNLNGPPHTVLQLAQDLTLVGRVHLGYVPNHTDPVDVGFVKSPGPIDNNAHALIYSFDTAGKVARLYLDGQLVSETHDVRPVDATTASRFIGAHYDRPGFGFTGDIAEVLVFDDSLSTDEAAELSQWLLQKYGLPSSTPKITMKSEGVRE